MKKIVRRLVTTFIMFSIASYGASYCPEFMTTILKGAALGALVWPPIYMHYSDEDKYAFSYSKGD